MIEKSVLHVRSDNLNEISLSCNTQFGKGQRQMRETFNFISYLRQLHALRAQI